MTHEKEAKVFISYSWTKGDFVLKLARQLLADGVDVVLDKWDLKEGQAQPRLRFCRMSTLITLLM